MIRLRSQVFTDYHISLLTQEILDRVSGVLSKQLEQKSLFQSLVGSGILFSDYNESRFMGANSAVRNKFRMFALLERRIPLDQDLVQVYQNRAHESFMDRIQIETLIDILNPDPTSVSPSIPHWNPESKHDLVVCGIKYFPDTDRIQIHSLEYWCKEKHEADKRNRELLQGLSDLILPETSKSVIAKLRCPWCKHQLEIFSRETKSNGVRLCLSCSNESCQAFIEKPATDLPSWIAHNSEPSDQIDYLE